MHYSATLEQADAAIRRLGDVLASARTSIAADDALIVRMSDSLNNLVAHMTMTSGALLYHLEHRDAAKASQACELLQEYLDITQAILPEIEDSLATTTGVTP